ncbi:MAG: DUF1512 family protein [Methanobacterium sp.]|uniref:DUF1512 family protein n=1 Tax=Methanobacterium sp. TaxID=2164 RepID=UPI003D6558DD|nr:DUF1512 family protein [Methanobacterium sp.]
MLFGLSPFDLIGILVFILLIFLLPWILRVRMISGVTKTTLELEDMVEKSKQILIKMSKEKGKPVLDQSEAIEDFMEFFVVPPVDLDPNGIVKKFEKILDLSEDRFKQMVSIIAPLADAETKSNIVMTLKATLGINAVAKQVRHNLELSRKTGNLQILLMLQMSLPLIMRIVKAQFEGAKSFSEGKPIGDGLGPLVAGMLMKDYKNEEITEMEDMFIAKKLMNERKLVIARAKGPGARMGKVGKVVKSLIETENINKIITVDAAVKLEGEETGKVAQGIGVVIGGLGVDKWTIEEEIVKKDLDIDAVIVKMSPEEAISNMNQKIADASKEALRVVKRSILNSKDDINILVVGVGNSCGIPNIIEDISQIEVKKAHETKVSGRRK